MSEIPSVYNAEKEVWRESNNDNKKCDFSLSQKIQKNIAEFIWAASKADEKLEELWICGWLDDLMDNYSDIPYDQIDKPIIKYIAEIINKSNVNNKEEIIDILNNIGIYNIKEWVEVPYEISNLQRIITSEILDSKNMIHPLKDDIIKDYKNTNQVLKNIPMMNESELNKLIALFFSYQWADRRYYIKNQLEPIIEEKLNDYPRNEKLALASKLVKWEIQCLARRKWVIYLDQEKKTLVYIGLSTGYYDNNTIKVLDYTPGNHKNTARVQNKNKT